MTRGELDAERRMEKIRAKIVRAEIKRIKRKEQIEKHLVEIVDVMSMVLLIMLLIGAFWIDGYGAQNIPTPVYAVGIIYLFLYASISYRRFIK